MGLKIRSDSAERRCGLFERALAASVAFARTFGDEEYAACERLLCTSLLGTDCYAALFAADLWLLLMRWLELEPTIKMFDKGRMSSCCKAHQLLISSTETFY